MNRQAHPPPPLAAFRSLLSGGVTAVRSGVLEKGRPRLLRNRHDMLDNPKTPAHSSLSRIAIYHAPLGAKNLSEQPKTGHVGQIQGMFKIKSALISSKLAQLWDRAGRAGRAGKIKLSNPPFSGTILHAPDLPPIPPVILGAAHSCPGPAGGLIS